MATRRIALFSQTDIFNVRQQADEIRRRGINAYQLNQFEEAMRFWQQALALYENLDASAVETQILGYLGAAASQLENYSQAADYFRQALQLAQQLEDLRQVEELRNNLVVVYDALGEQNRQQRNFYPAIAYYQAALRLNQIPGSRRGGSLLHRLGLSYHGLNHYSVAIQFYEKSLAGLSPGLNLPLKANVLNDLGRAHRDEGHLVEALGYHQSALAIEKQLGDLQSQVRTLGNLGLVYVTLGSYDAALQQFQQSLAIASIISDRTGIATAIGNIGAAYADKGDYLRAVEFYEQSLTALRRVGDSRAEARTLLNLATAYQIWQQNLDRAAAYYQQSLAMAKAIDDRWVQAEALASLGFVEEGQGDYELALSYYDQGLAIFQGMGDRQGAAMTLNNRAHTLLAWGQKALAENQSIWGQEKLQEARDNLRSAIALLDSLRSGLKDDVYRISLFDTQVMTYNLLQQVQVELGEEMAALEASEQGRTRALTALLDEKETFAGADYSLAALKAVSQAQNATIVEYSLIPDERFVHQGKLRGTTAELYMWVIEPNGQVHFHREDMRQHNLDLAQLITLTRRGIGVRSRGGFAPAEENGLGQSPYLNDLYHLLIAPILDWLPKDPDAPVVFIPQGELFLVPFSALRNDAGEYLIKHHTLLSAPSIQVLAKAEEIALAQNALAQPQAQQTETLIVGNPIMPEIWNAAIAQRESLANLPGAQQEAQAIAALFEVSPLIGSAATEQTVTQRMAAARLLHFATHGLLDDFGTGIPGAIALTPDSQHDGLLTATEITALKLTAGLVVLSACDTGLGDISGDGVIGLSRSFIAAGVPSIVVSLWSIPDAPTAELMTEFYQQMQQGKNKAQALRQAMLKTMETHLDPGDWAAFTLIGEAD